MVDWVFVAFAARCSMRQSAFIFNVILLSLVIFFAAAGLHMEFADGRIVQAAILGIRLESPTLLLTEFLPPTVHMITMMVLFLSILVPASMYPSLVRDPLFPIFVSKRFDRRRVFYSTIIGLLGPQLILVCLSGILIVLITVVKLNGVFTATPLSLTLLMEAQICLIASLAVYLAVVSENATTVIIVVSLVSFLLSPWITSLDATLHPILKSLAFIIPPFGIMQQQTSQALAGNPLQWGSLFAPGLFCVVLVLLAERTFVKKEW